MQAKELLHIFNSNKAFALIQEPDSKIATLYIANNTRVLSSLNKISGDKAFIISPFNTNNKDIILLEGLRIEHIPSNILSTLRENTIEENNFNKKANSLKDTEIENKIDSKGNNDLEYKKADIGEKVILNTAISDSYKYDFQAFQNSFQRGIVEKLVLSRREDIVSTCSPLDLFVHLCNLYPQAYNFVISTEQTGMWIGSSPEIFLKAEYNRAETVSLAGTLFGENVKWDKKNIREQSIVSQFIKQRLQDLGINQIQEKGPYTLHLNELNHLKTEFHFDIPDTLNWGKLLSALFPTPAVCGYPKDKAFELINTIESNNREYYSGLIGLIDKEDKSSIYVNLRSAKYNKNTSTYTLYAGGGIMPESIIEKEWEESTRKMNTIAKLL